MSPETPSQKPKRIPPPTPQEPGVIIQVTEGARPPKKIEVGKDGRQSALKPRTQEGTAG